MRNAGTRLVDAQGNVVPSAPYAYGGAHSSGSQARLGAILEDPETFSDAEARVIMWYLFRSPGHGEPVRMMVSDIADRLGMTRQGLTRIVKRLRERRILIERDRVGRTPFYAISPYLGGHGPGLEQRSAIRECNPPEIPAADIKAAPITPVRSTTRRTA
ncbi:helix-turn-helix transcriptional regulator [Streptomyces albireticuli]|uniref:MarR family transcriptional regulator n=1 Tax=Streptomyces albireticuli TaxID=1940 RepID=A0A2A2D1B8_9ACTN|nr:winged helix-turn-helix domain-containing protein [Streptomyces albireticuli]MCD9145918.1 winged helix-turn-helix domain-containing protein [Streptomyces albireticuli]MCD9166088.1 winged helix-turn-helix domain-containing protein [Streptomyces albireticuli]MCD9196368.1 winged helix-turn-helix domain-containing protein [Streptomyces albireticuli]PAU45305.1 MarR family transcriptional regulator [Streptomyces albireticuli]